MKILFPKENQDLENRLSLSLETLKKYQKLGFEVIIEADAGKKINISDNDFIANGAKITNDLNRSLAEADIIVSISRYDFNVDLVKNSTILITSLANASPEDLSKLKNSSLQVFALEKTPRISRAQNIDILSSQSNLAGYIAVIEAAKNLGKALPLMMTAAGTIRAAKFMIIGAGVAGLQAIATAKRLGALVCAFDVRKAAKEQVQSLGAKFIEVAEDRLNDSDKNASNSPFYASEFYASEMSVEYQKKQQELLLEKIAEQDVVITTALIMGKKAPILITSEMVSKMKSGSIIVDVATSGGGNCYLTAEKCNEDNPIFTTENQVKIIGYNNFTNLVPIDASQLIAKNFYHFVELIFTNQQININYDDEIIKATLLQA